ncbi:Uncharacterized protein FWK35_00022202 [Aphis craccivora]|uniref:Uncharacterized protein n=1 Tax=Aphis craccivora TaxID=307492 RepID=A0A6G0XKA4_APHCR|nr:Uncharacterized protein FWK35_00022202 [Aphis craccivora]
MASCPNVTLYGIQIPPSQSVKYPGLLLDRRLTWAQHTKSKRLKLSNRLRMLSSLLHRNTHTNLKIKLLIYKTGYSMKQYVSTKDFISNYRNPPRWIKCRWCRDLLSET